MSSKLDEHRSEIIAAVSGDEKPSQRSLAKKYGVARSTLQYWLSKNHIDHLFDGLNEGPSEEYEELPVIFRDYSDRQYHYIYPMGDVHKGSPAHAEDRWLEWLGYLEANDNLSLLCTGDLFNAALKDSVSDVYDEKLTVGRAKKVLRKELKGLAGQGKIDLLMPGNHDDRVYKAVGDCPVEDLAEGLQVPYAKDAVLLVYIVGGITYEVYVKHGTGAGQVGARANRLQKASQTIIADIYVSGHTHSQLVFPQEVFKFNPATAKVERRRQLFVSSGSFLNYEPYAAKAGYTPQKIGAPRIRLAGDRHDPHVSI